MSFVYTHYMLPSLVAVFLCLTTGAMIWPRRHAPGASVFLILMAAVVAWTGCQAVMLAVIGVDAKVLVSKVQYIAIVATPVLLLLFSVRYSRGPQWAGRTLFGFVSVIPAVTVLLAWTNESHGLIWASRDIAVEGAMQALIVEHGPWFGVFTVFSYATILLAIAIILRRFGKTRYHRGQIVLLALVPLAVMAFNVVYLLEVPPFERLDGTPIGFSVGMVLCGIALYRYKLFDLMPVAREALFDSIQDAVIVLDRQNRIAELNPSARVLLPEGSRALIGAPAKEVLPAHVLEVVLRGEGGEIAWPSRNLERTYDMKISDVNEETGLPGGRIVILHDVSKRKLIQAELMRARDELRKTNEELERLAHRDSLTGLANRRSLYSRLDEEVLRYRRFQAPLSVVMADLDDFKSINDRFGHMAGDRVLTAVARVLDQCRLNIDVAARLGGEEFAVLLPGTRAGGAEILAERLRERIEALVVDLPGGGSVSVTASLGLVEIEPGMDGGDLIRGADTALYRAKEQGKNRVCLGSSVATA